MTQRDISQPVRALATTQDAQEVFCVSRSIRPIGKIRCNCSMQPEVFKCSHPFVTSGYCLRQVSQQPGDGPIVLPDGSKIESPDERHRYFIAWPLKPDESPRPWEAIVCSTCPHQSEPPPHILRLMKLGIDGNYNPETGHCDVLHVLSQVAAKPDFVTVPAGLRECSVTAIHGMELQDMVAATNCRLLIVYQQAVNIHAVKSVAEGNPSLKTWLVMNDPRQKRETILNVWYDLPDDLEAEAKRQQRAAYEAAIARILE